MTDLDLSQHPDKIKCRMCGEVRVKTFGKLAPNKRTIWVDEFGERWYGKRCPPCYKEYKVKYDTKNRLKLGYRPFGSFDYCIDCKSRFVVKVGSTKRCSHCTHQELMRAKNSIV